MGFVEEMKWWQWIAVSLGLGALLGYLNSTGANAPVEHASISQMVFETGLMQLPHVDPVNQAHLEPMISGIIVHPVEEVQRGGKTATVQLVSFNALNPNSPGHPSGTMQRTDMFAQFPYEPQPRYKPSTERPEWPGCSVYEGQSGDTIQSLAARFYHKATPRGVQAIISANDVLRGAKNAAESKIVVGRYYWIPWNPADGHNVQDFLIAADKLIQSQRGKDAIPVTFHFTWWESPNHAYAIWMTGSFLLIGVIWPSLLYVMVRGGLGRTRPEEFELRRYKPSPVATAAPKPSTTATKDDMQQLREMEESLEASLRASASASGPAAPQAAPAAPAIKVLDGSADPAPAAPMTPEEQKAYQGEFYPVVRPSEKKTD